MVKVQKNIPYIYILFIIIFVIISTYVYMYLRVYLIYIYVADILLYILIIIRYDTYVHIYEGTNNNNEGTLLASYMHGWVPFNNDRLLFLFGAVRGSQKCYPRRYLRTKVPRAGSM